MTGEKNRFKTTEQLWKLDDKQLKTPKHDAMVLWLMDEKNSKDMIHTILLKETIESWVLLKKEDSDRISCPHNIKDLFRIHSEVPIKSSDKFIAGYGDLVFEVRLSSLQCKVPRLVIGEDWLIESIKCDNAKEMTELLSKFLNVKCDSMYFTDEDYVSFDYIYRSPYGSIHDDLDSIKERDFIWNVYHEKYAEHFFEDEFKHCKLSPSEVVNWVKGESDVYLSYEIGQTYRGTIYFDRVLVEVKPYIDSFGAVLRQIKSYRAFSNYDIYCLFTLDDRFDSQFESQGIIVLHPPDDVNIDDMLEMYDLVENKEKYTQSKLV